MAAPHSNRIPIRGWLVPLVALAAGLVVGKNDAWIIGAALAVMLIGSVMVAVHHAELVALWLGEPYGTLVLTLAVTIIELSLIISLMLTHEPSPGLARDTVHAVVMLVLNGLAGICIVAGTLRHREQQFRTLGANAFLAVLMPMAILVLVLPNYTEATPGPSYSTVNLSSSASSVSRSTSCSCSCRPCATRTTSCRQVNLRPSTPPCHRHGLARSAAHCWCCRWSR